MSNRKERGSSFLEFTLVGIPLVFILICTFEISRAMWIYHTIAFAVKESTRLAIVKGRDCVENGNTCGVQVSRIAQEVWLNGVGLDPDLLNLTLTTTGGSGGAITGTLRQLAGTCTGVNAAGAPICTGGNATPWPTLGTTPADPGSDPGQRITIQATYTFPTALAFFWPGAGRGWTFGNLTFGSQSRETIQF